MKSEMFAVKNGVGASCVVVAQVEGCVTVLDYLQRRFPAVGLAVWRQRLADGKVMTARGAALLADEAVSRHCGQKWYYYREVVAEKTIPFQAAVVYEDEHILVADKPHFLPVMPAGPYVQETLLVRLRQTHDLPELTPLHRIDRETAGLVLFAKTRAVRGKYQALFRQRHINKYYEAIAPWRPEQSWPLLYSSHLAESGDFFRMAEVTGKPANAHTKIEVVAHHRHWARYQLQPISGKRHQLRVQMAALGLPLLHDRFYPVATRAADDFSRPLQLLAKRLQFIDPISGHAHDWCSGRCLLDVTTLAHLLPATYDVD